MKRDIAVLRNDVEDMKSVNRRIIATLVRLEGKVDDMAERMATKEDVAELRSDMLAKFDGFARRYDDQNFRPASHADQLTLHDKRIVKLESRRS